MCWKISYHDFNEGSPREPIHVHVRGALRAETDLRVCLNSGEDYVDSHVTDELLRSAENPASVGTQVDIRRYACW